MSMPAAVACLIISMIFHLSLRSAELADVPSVLEDTDGSMMMRMAVPFSDNGNFGSAKAKQELVLSKSYLALYQSVMHNDGNKDVRRYQLTSSYHFEEGAEFPSSMKLLKHGTQSLYQLYAVECSLGALSSGVIVFQLSQGNLAKLTTIGGRGGIEIFDYNRDGNDDIVLCLWEFGADRLDLELWKSDVSGKRPVFTVEKVKGISKNFEFRATATAKSK